MSFNLRLIMIHHPVNMNLLLGSWLPAQYAVLRSWQQSVCTYTCTILHCHFGSLFVWSGIEKNSKKMLKLLIYFTEQFEISTECVRWYSCHSVIILYCGMNLIKNNRTFCCVFLYRAMLRGNQHGGRKYDDLQNWFDVMPHENPLLRQCVRVK